jgi:hypothetical protein
VRAALILLSEVRQIQHGRYLASSVNFSHTHAGLLRWCHTLLASCCAGCGKEVLGVAEFFDPVLPAWTGRGP